MKTTLSLRLPDEVAEKLEDLANETHRSKTYIIRTALEQYLTEYSEYQVALDRLKDKDDEIISSKEMRERLGL